MNISKYRLIRERVAGYEVNGIITEPRKVFELATKFLSLGRLGEEEFHIISLDVKNQVVGVHMVSHGNNDTSIVDPKAVFQRALLDQANSLILIHNHPSGDPSPSYNDKKVTENLKDAGKLLNIEIMDHIIVTEDHYYSFKEHDLIQGVTK